MKHLFRSLFFATISLLIANCARKGRPEGGPKDETAPLMVTADPPYETTQFNEKEIKIYFDEYITLKDLNKQLVVSPPLKNPPLITPQGSPSKYIKIEILDTLLQNTTYIFNFGNSVEDNNEGNKLERFKYVFSTESYIDSLTSSGKIKDALLDEPDKSINVLLYKIDSSYTDSIVYKKKPNYVTSTLDTTNFDFSNLRKGKYLLIALKEATNDYIFNSKTDKIGFSPDTIYLPQDSIISKPLRLFKEKQPYTFKRGKEITKGRIMFGFEGEAKDLKINILSKTPEGFKSISKFEQDKDTLNYWFTPIEADSLNFLVTNKNEIDTVTVKLRKKKSDSLTIKASTLRTLHLRDTLFLETNNPIIKLDTSKISLTDKDTIPVPFKGVLSSKKNRVDIIFDKKPVNSYSIKILPKALSDIYAQQNDSLAYNLSTKELEDYGRITLTVQNIVSEALIIELLDDKGNLIERKFTSRSETLIFDLLEPQKYKVRAIIDRNKNKQWDTGNFLKRVAPEHVIYFPVILEVRANYFLNETFTINDSK